VPWSSSGISCPQVSGRKSASPTISPGACSPNPAAPTRALHCPHRYGNPHRRRMPPSAPPGTLESERRSVVHLRPNGTWSASVNAGRRPGLGAPDCGTCALAERPPTTEFS
jgi:hypothetical protein